MRYSATRLAGASGWASMVAMLCWLAFGLANGNCASAALACAFHGKGAMRHDEAASAAPLCGSHGRAGRVCPYL